MDWKLIISLIVALLLILLFNFFIGKLKKKLLSNAKSKKQISNIKLFTRILSFSFFILLVILISVSYVTSWAGFGIFAGLFSAGLGWALQKPITGIAAWLMVILKKPFSVGDRVLIGNVKGEVYDITLTHIYLDEIGGLIDTEEFSGRTIMVPNHLLFEHNIINYTLIDDFVLAEIAISISLESDLEKAVKIIQAAVNNHVSKFLKDVKKEPSTLFVIKAGSMIIQSRFFVPVSMINPISSEIIKEIYNKFKKQKIKLV